MHCARITASMGSGREHLCDVIHRWCEENEMSDLLVVFLFMIYDLFVSIISSYADVRKCVYLATLSCPALHE